MEEKYEGGEIKIRSPFMEKVENFWYHYKWHSLIALFLILTVTICSLQMCNRADYDLHILYAGQSDVRKTSGEGLSAHSTLLSSLKQVTEDYDGDEKQLLNLLTLFLPSAEEIEEINARLEAEGEGYEVQTHIVTENADQMHQLMVLSDYYLCFLSEANYLSYRDRAEDFFVSLSPYVGSAAVTYYEGRTDAVYLHSTAFGSLPGFAELPEDTLICLRGVSEVAKRADRKGSARNFESAEKTLRNIFAMQEK